MDTQETLKQQVADAARGFFEEHMSMTPESIQIDIHFDCLVVTLNNAISMAETAYTKEKLSRGLLARCYEDTFDASKLIFEASVGKVFPQRITGSFMSLHPESGKCVVIVSLCGNNSQKA